MTGASSPGDSGVIGAEYIRTDPCLRVTVAEVLEQASVANIRGWQGA